MLCRGKAIYRLIWDGRLEAKVLGLLIDQPPWGFSTIRHGWLTAPVTVSRG